MPDLKVLVSKSNFLKILSIFVIDAEEAKTRGYVIIEIILELVLRLHQSSEKRCHFRK